MFLNQRLRVAKQAALPTDKTSTGSLTAAALKRARDACVAEWQLLTQEQKRPYKDLFEARLAERRRIATERLESGPGEGNAGPLCPSSHWGCGSGTAVVHPKLVREALAATGRLPPPAEVYNTTEFTITSPEESPMLGAGLQLEPCHLLGRPVCKTHPKHKHLSQIHNAMKVMTDRLGKDVVATGDVLCLFEGAHSDGAHEVFALLTRASYSPKFQDWTLCKPLATEVGRGALEFPVLVELDSRLLPALPGGLATAATTLRTETSDYLALRLSEMALEWRLRVCRYGLLSPARMRVVGVDPGEAFDIRCGSAGGNDRRGQQGGVGCWRRRQQAPSGRLAIAN